MGVTLVGDERHQLEWELLDPSRNELTIPRTVLKYSRDDLKMRDKGMWVSNSCKGMVMFQAQCPEKPQIPKRLFTAGK